jgi:hypothetical protein
MASGNQMDRRDFDIAASQEAQSRFERVATRLEALIGQRDADVRTAMANYEADGVSEQYHAKEVRWNTVATQVRSIITTLRGTLGQNDQAATEAMQRARTAVESIG